MNDDMASIFREELRDLLESLERGLMDLKSRPEDAGLVNQVFRDLHTVKGSGAMFGFSDLAAFIHAFETAFDRVRSGKVPVTPDLIRLGLSARDEIPGLVDGTPDPEGRRDGILSALQVLTSGEVAAPPPATAAPAATEAAAPSAPSRLTFRLTGAALALGSRPELLLNELRELGAQNISADLTRLPELAGLDVDACHVGWHMDLPPAVSRGQVEDVFMFADAEWSIETAAPEPSASGLPANDDAEDAAPVVAPQAEGVASVAPVAGAASPVVRRDAPPAAAPAAAEAAATVRVPAERLDALMDSVGELVTVEARLTELARQSRDPALMATAEQVTRLAGRLRDAAMTMRMVPLRSLVARFRRLIHGLSDTLGKPVNFVVIGEETELDKTVIEKLADPLVHILRNAIDHGMELPEGRAAAGKEPEGTIELSAAHAGGEVLIRVRDDGRGMNPEVIRAKAIERGLITAEAVLTESQIFTLVFEPGFSTAEAVTELSGRGVGMDVVRRTIEGLRGRIDIESAFGKGTTVTLRLPLTLAIIEGLLVEVAGERYTLPMSSVQEIVELPADKLKPSRSGDFLDIRGHFVPFLRLRGLFNCDGIAPSEQNVVILQSGEGRVGVVVDRIIGTNQTVIKQMSKLHRRARCISGATILGDGSVALIVDVPQLVSSGRAQTEGGKEAAA